MNLIFDSINEGPFPKNVGKPHEQNRMLCEANFALECRLQIGNYKGML